MATTIGRVDFLVDFDGKKLPAKARKIGNDIGNNIGSEASQRFLTKFSSQVQQLIPQMGKTGRLSGHRLADSMAAAIDTRLAGLSRKIADAFLTPDSLRDTLASFDDLDDGARRLRLDLQELHDTGNLSEKMWKSLGGSLNQALGEMRKTRAGAGELTEGMEGLDRELREKVTDVDKVGDSFDGLTKKLEDNSKSTKKNHFHWKSLGHNLRQAILIVTAIAAGSGEIAVLGSAAGAGLLIFASAALTAASGLGVLIAGLQGVGDDLKLISERNELLNILPEDLTDTQLARLDELQAKIAKFDDSIFAIQRLGGAFTKMQDDIQNALLKGAGPAIDTFTKTFVARLGEGFVVIATALNDSLIPLLEDLSTEAAQSKITELLEGMAAQLPFIVSAFGHLGSAIGNFLIIATPFVQDFVEGLDNMLARFEGFTESQTGRDQITEFLENGTFILEKFINLLDEAGELLAGLVDAKTVKQTGEFLDNLAGAMPFLQDLLEVFTELDVFGLIAQLLNDVGNALSPVLELLEPIATIINGVLSVALDGLATVLNLITPLFYGLELSLKVLSYVLQPFIDYAKQTYEVMSKLGDPFDDVAESIFKKITPALDRLIDTLLDLLPSPTELARIIEEEVLPAIEDFAEWLAKYGAKSLELLITALTIAIDAIGKLPGTIAKIESFSRGVQIIMKQIVRAFSGPIGAVQNLIDLIRLLNRTPIQSKGFGTLGKANAEGGILGGMAAGGIAHSMRWINDSNFVGESGPEAIVPLMRALNQVDPSVRPLAAFAQGILPDGWGGKRVVVEPGAIVVTGVANPVAAAEAMLDRLVVKLGA